jgi:acyl-CoA thioesterase-1
MSSLLFRSLRTASVWYLVLTSLLTACSAPDVPSLPRLDTGAVILAFGDSLTYGKGVSRHQSYPAVLEGLIGRKVINAGRSGEVTAAGVKRLPALLKKYDPDLVILCHGGNDILQNLDPAMTAANLREMAQMVLDHGASLVLVGVPERGLSFRSAEIYARLAEELGLPLEDEVLGEIMSDRSLKSDMVHPNEHGYRRMAETLAQLLRASGAI